MLYTQILFEKFELMKNCDRLNELSLFFSGFLNYIFLKKIFKRKNIFFESFEFILDGVSLLLENKQIIKLSLFLETGIVQNSVFNLISSIIDNQRKMEIFYLFLQFFIIL